MSRKPYQHQQPANWYMASNFYKLYMLRELTSVPVAIASFNLFWGIAALALASPEAWTKWLAVQAHPLMIIFNLFAIVAALFNTIKWFEAMPKAIRVQIGEKFVEDKKMILGNWVVFAAITIVLLALVILMA
ncbi:fumarate reductase subunit C [Suttonella sp. R2A3]|uniref:fumarate reductase subunit C n=1 Tax=Suttonella sp. R2A3 TaxID=2908648 RepID=UPI001F46E225|nr:fumarate reductase subunit C [Suttonella sp. R2A3]UJF25215.1 fumarate reductase subunit C [Suttonella sp. R2A3]